MMRPLRGALLALALLGVFAPAARPQNQPENPPAVAAAASLQFALPRIVDAYAARTGQAVTVAYGASGNLARQIRQGAPFEIFLSADEAFVAGLAEDGLTRDDGRIYARGRVVLFVPNGAPLTPDGRLDDLAAALEDGRLTRLAIANPEHAPYGRLAEEVLRHRGLWEAIGPRLVMGENVGQAARFAASGNASGGLIAQSLAAAPQMAERGSFGAVPADWHAPLNQRMVLLAGAGPAAEAFFAFLGSAEARAILRASGFDPPPGAD